MGVQAEDGGTGSAPLGETVMASLTLSYHLRNGQTLALPSGAEGSRMGLGAWENLRKALLRLEAWGVPAAVRVLWSLAGRSFPLAHTLVKHTAPQPEG